MSSQADLGDKLDPDQIGSTISLGRILSCCRF
jgi:hypothetical protein